MGKVEELLNNPPDLWHPHSIGISHNEEDDTLDPTVATKMAYHGIVAFVERVLVTNPDYKTFILCSADVSQRFGKPYGIANAEWLEELVHLKGLGETITVIKKPEGLDAWGEMEAYKSVLEGLFQHFGGTKIPVGVAVQLAAYRPKMEIYAERMGLPNMIQMSTEALMLTTRPDTVQKLLRRFGQQVYTEFEIAEIKSQLTTLKLAKIYQLDDLLRWVLKNVPGALVAKENFLSR